MSIMDLTTKISSINSDNPEYESTVLFLSEALYNYKGDDRLFYAEKLCMARIPLATDPKEEKQLASACFRDIFSNDDSPIIPGEIFFPLGTRSLPSFDRENLKEVVDTLIWHPRSMAQIISLTFPYTTKQLRSKHLTKSDLLSFILLIFIQNLYSVIAKISDCPLTRQSAIYKLAKLNGCRITPQHQEFWSRAIVDFGKPSERLKKSLKLSPISTNRSNNVKDYIRGKPQNIFPYQPLHYGLLGLLYLQLDNVDYLFQARFYMERFIKSYEQFNSADEECTTACYKSCKEALSKSVAYESSIDAVNSTLDPLEAPSVVPLYDTIAPIIPNCEMGSRKSRIKALLDKIKNVDAEPKEQKGYISPFLNLSSRQSMIGRRSSVFNPSRLSLAQTSSAPLRDPRPIREKQWQTSSIKSLISFLAQSAFPHTISPRTLQTPAAKDFQNIFKFLYSKLDPNYQYAKKFEEEVPIILKGLRYPFADQILRSHLQSVGTMHSWPTLLAVLTWMVELIMCCDQLEQSDGYEDDSSHAQKIFYNYLIKTYQVFLAGFDNYDQINDELQANFDRKNEQVLLSVDKLTKQNETLELELAALNSSEPPLKIQQRDNEALLVDLDRVERFLDFTDSKRSKASDISQSLASEITLSEAALEQVLAEKTSLQQAVDSQEISPADVDRMNSERDSLSLSLNQLATKQEEINSRVWNKEVEIQREMDNLESSIKGFNGLASDLGLDEAAYEDNKKVRFELSLNFHSAKSESMLNLDIKNVVKPTLAKLRTKHQMATHRVEDENIALAEQIERTTEQIAEDRDELTQLQENSEKLIFKYNEQKEITGKSILSSKEEKESLEDETQKIRIDNTLKRSQSHQLTQAKTIEFNQAMRKLTDQSEINVKLVYKAAEEFMIFSNRVNENLHDLQELVQKENSDAFRSAADDEDLGEI